MTPRVTSLPHTFSYAPSFQIHIPFGAQSNVLSHPGVLRTTSSPGSGLDRTITGSQNRVPRTLAVVNEPVSHAFTHSPTSAPSSDSFPLLLLIDLLLLLQLSFNGFGSSTTTANDAGNDGDEDRSGWKAISVRGPGHTVVPDKRETVKILPRHPLSNPHNVREDGYKKDRRKGDENKRPAIIMDGSPSMSVAPPGPNHQLNARVSSFSSVASPRNSQHSTTWVTNGPLMHRGCGSNHGLANMASKKSASASVQPQ
ncbi:hypothetical protein DL96DRAFT_1720251 [Flagelloscypha sp. PMI_526]|nr:hypothetical protein DL96DRAFT_1720251 [Flagelloscypha sp. PMI_526]